MHKDTILLITSNFAPENTGIALYSYDLASVALQEQYDVEVLTCYPHHPSKGAYENFDFSNNTFEKKSMRISRIKCYLPNSGRISNRLRFELSFLFRAFIFSIRNLGKRKKNVVAIIGIVPSLSCGILARIISAIWSIPYMVIIQDFVSLAVKESGIPLASNFRGLVRFFERNVLQNAKRVTAISEGMRTQVLQDFPKVNTVRLIHNYSLHEPVTLQRNQARQKLGISDEIFLVVHTGNMGYKQDLLNVVKAARLLQGYSEMSFWLVGDGNQREVIQTHSKDLENCLLLPQFDVGDYPFLLAAADILLVNERKSVEKMSLPSKLTSYLIAGRPIVAAVSQTGETARFLEHFARILDPGDPSALAEAILDVKSNPKEFAAMINRGTKFAIESLAREVGRKKYLEEVSELIRS